MPGKLTANDLLNTLPVPKNGVMFVRAAVPSNWNARTDLYDYHLRMANASRGTTNTGSHSHDLPAHSHSVGVSTSNTDASPSGDQTDADHAHGGSISGGSASQPYAAHILKLPSYTLTPVQFAGVAATAGAKVLHTDFAVATFGPSGLIIWYDADESIPTGWSVCNSTNGTPDWASAKRFVKGQAGATGAGSTGGSDTHTHTDTHATHSAGGIQGTYSTRTDADSTGPNAPPNSSKTDHVHAIGAASTATGSGTSIPKSKEGYWIMNLGTLGSAGGKLTIEDVVEAIQWRSGLIGVVHTDTIPTGWTRRSELEGRYPLMSATPGSTDAGTYTHGHTASGTHDHGNTGGPSPSGYRGGGGSTTVMREPDSHTHAITAVASAADSAAASEPSYVTVHFVEKN